MTYEELQAENRKLEAERDALKSLLDRDVPVMTRLAAENMVLRAAMELRSWYAVGFYPDGGAVVMMRSTDHLGAWVILLSCATLNEAYNAVEDLERAEDRVKQQEPI